ncbi:hypothetical protein GCM10022232_87580 [Streptomyces plumbiresistens]|uniref:Uncharacterized protein n=1 Tax=Streptomyces plumbiresistens TaxID=511811 RepID=A0ABP7TLT3_9ACTN
MPGGGRRLGLRDWRDAARVGKQWPDHSNPKRVIVEEAGAINNVPAEPDAGQPRGGLLTVSVPLPGRPLVAVWARGVESVSLGKDGLPCRVTPRFLSSSMSN